MIKLPKRRPENPFYDTLETDDQETYHIIPWMVLAKVGVDILNDGKNKREYVTKIFTEFKYDRKRMKLGTSLPHNFIENVVKKDAFEVDIEAFLALMSWLPGNIVLGIDEELRKNDYNDDIDHEALKLLRATGSEYARRVNAIDLFLKGPMHGPSYLIGEKVELLSRLGRGGFSEVEDDWKRVKRRAFPGLKDWDDEDDDD